jgi:signal transduction histidine kinase
MSTVPADPDREQLLAVIALLQTQGEVQRLQLARQLHDELGGLLAAIRMGLAAPTPDLQQQLAQALQIQRAAVESLRPGLLEHFGLAAALQAQVEAQCQAAGVTLQAQWPAQALPLGSDAATALYRTALTLVAQLLQAGAGELRLVLAASGSGCTLQLEGAAPAEVATAPQVIAQALWLRRLGGNLQASLTAAGLRFTAALPAMAEPV